MLTRVWGWVKKRWAPPHRDIVLVRVDALGDAVLGASALWHYRRCFEGRHLTLVANATWAEWVSEWGVVDEVVPLAVGGRWGGLSGWQRVRLLGQWLGVMWALSRWRANMVVHLSVHRGIRGDVVAGLIRSPIRWGVVGPTHNYRRWIHRLPGLGYQAMGRRYHPTVSIESDTMVLQANARVASAITGVRLEPAVMDLRGLTQKSPLAPPYMVWCPFAGDTDREWPITHWYPILRPLSMPLVVVGSGPEPVGLRAVMADLIQEGRLVLDWVGQTDLATLASVLSGASLYMGNESGVTHLAAALHIPSVMVMGGGHAGLFAPYHHEAGPIVCHHPLPCNGCNWRCSHPHYQKGSVYPCIRLIDPVTVAQTLTHIPAMTHDAEKRSQGIDDPPLHNGT